MMTPDQALIFFTDRKNAYRLAFGAEAGKAVLADLSLFCRENETCVVPGARDLTYVLEGRREVFLRIQDYLKRTPEELVAMFTREAEKGKTDDQENRSQR